MNIGGKHDFSFRNVGEFTEHVLEKREQFRKTECLGHNGSRYDSILEARTIIEEQGLGNNVRMITQVNKIIEITLRTPIVFRDTYDYMGVKLVSLPKTLELDTNLQNGEFPYLFNTIEDQK